MIMGNQGCTDHHCPKPTIPASIAPLETVIRKVSMINHTLDEAFELVTTTAIIAMVDPKPIISAKPLAITQRI